MMLAQHRPDLARLPRTQSGKSCIFRWKDPYLKSALNFINMHVGRPDTSVRGLHSWERFDNKRTCPSKLGGMRVGNALAGGISLVQFGQPRLSDRILALGRIRGASARWRDRLVHHARD